MYITDIKEGVATWHVYNWELHAANIQELSEEYFYFVCLFAGLLLLL